jgi:hypothetical protein
MQRRQLLATALIAMVPRSLFPAPGSIPDAAPHAEAIASGWAFRAFAAPGTAARSELATLNVKVWEFRTGEEAADAFAAAGQLVVLEQPAGEIYVQDTQLITPIPDLDLPAELLTYTIVAGAAAVETSFGMAVMQRDRFLWGMFARSGHEAEQVSGPGGESSFGMADIVTDLAVRLANRQIRREEVTTDEEGMFHGGLWDLLPDWDDVPDDMILEAQDASDGHNDGAGANTTVTLPALSGSTFRIGTPSPENLPGSDSDPHAER